MKVLFLVKNYYKLGRPSGVGSYLTQCARALRACGVNVTIAYATNSPDLRQALSEVDGVSLTPFKTFDFGGVAKLAAENDKVIVFSSASSGFLIFIWWWLLTLGVRREKLAMYQTTNLRLNQFSKFVVAKLFSRNRWLVASSSISALMSSCSIDSSRVYPGLCVDSLVEQYPRGGEKKYSASFMGHLSYVKGADLFLELAKRNPSREFLSIAGYSPGKKNKEFYSKLCGAMSCQKNLDHIGFISNPLEYLHLSKVLVLPYRSGNTVLGIAQSAIEAMALGIPVISTKNSAVMDLIDSGENGFICDDLNEIECCLYRLLDDDEYYQKMSEKCVLYVKKHHDFVNIAGDLLSGIR